MFASETGNDVTSVIPGFLFTDINFDLDFFELKPQTTTNDKLFHPHLFRSRQDTNCI
jgi:hypothetical protein